ncbi:prostaglandin reductase 1-like [Octopus vulgaris]|uniref:15-oxoprostaglandin 13-reductase n=1 Tax=Octopus vulgaris TaxID=6645 RepID=A0AA36FAD2_OCTVU|nr:prostaglandin reductase 1-like [Octopus vulgaris]
MVLSKKFVLAKHFVGKPSSDDIKLVTEELPDEVNDGEVLCEAVWLTVDPYMRIYTASLSEGDVIIGEQVARVIASKNPKFPEGTHVIARLGWKSHALVKDVSVLRKVPDIEDLPLSLILGSLGMPGLTAYFGFLEKCQPKSGETVLVTAAAGAVGSIVGQIAKIKGCKVVAFAGTEEKCSWLKNELGFDQVFNYKNIDLDKVLSSSVPDGIDCYFDNGKLIYKETITEGFENMPKAFLGLFEGSNIGKAIVKA